MEEIREELLKKEEELEKERMEYLEVNDKKNANRISKKIDKIRMEVDLAELNEYKKINKKYRLFIQKYGLTDKFNEFLEEE